MRLLFDENLSHRLVRPLSDLYPGSAHVRDVGLAGASDDEVWDYAREQGYMIVSKDADFYQRSILHGPPPKFVWLKVGNASTDSIFALLHGKSQEVFAFSRDEDAGFLVLGDT